MNRIEQYRAHLQQMCDWESYLLAESRLPGPRSNLELAQAVAEEGDESQFISWLALDAAAAPVNTPGEFLPFCGVLGLGQLLAEGDRSVLHYVRAAARDSRWRLREGAAMALQAWGRADSSALLAELDTWAGGDRYDQRAVVAGLCEPDLLREPDTANHALSLLDSITATVVGAADRREPGFVALRKALGYGWSVAIVASPEHGRPLLEKWAAVDDADARWIVRENLSKARLMKLDAGWVSNLKASAAKMDEGVPGKIDRTADQ